MTASATDLRFRLRQATRDAHLRLEAEVDFDRRMTSLEAYRGFMEEFYRFVRPVEAALSSCGLEELPIDCASRRKMGWIEADLKDLGHTNETLKELPEFSGAPPLANAIEALGALYVLEGSSLGRQVMLGKLSERLNIRPEWAGHFFNGYGKKTGAMWASFVAALNDAGKSERDAQTIENAALAAFAAFETCLAEGRLRHEGAGASP